MKDLSVSISIPMDEDGFVLLRCPRCGESFKLLSDDIQSEEVTDIHCPQCGLVSENYLTDDVIKLAQAKIINRLSDGFYNELWNMNRKTRNFTIKTNKFKREEEVPIRLNRDSMEMVDFGCCGRIAKIRYLLDYCGCYCAFCGGITDGSN